MILKIKHFYLIISRSLVKKHLGVTNIFLVEKKIKLRERYLII